MKSISPASAVSRIALIVAVLLTSTTSNAAEEPWKLGAEVYLWGANIDEAGLGQIYEKTQGWPAGLILMLDQAAATGMTTALPVA